MRGRFIAWSISLALGIGWIFLLKAAPAGYDPVVSLVVKLTGYLGVLIGIGIATGVLVGILTFLGTRPGTRSSYAGSLPADFTFGMCVILLSAPSLAVALGWWGG